MAIKTLSKSRANQPFSQKQRVGYHSTASTLDMPQTAASRPQCQLLQLASAARLAVAAASANSGAATAESDADVQCAASEVCDLEANGFQIGA